MDPAPFFPEIRDAVTGRIDARFATLLRQVEKTLAAQKRWKKNTGKVTERALLSEERKLRDLLKREAMREENALAGRRIALKRKVMKALRRHAGLVRKSDLQPAKVASVFRTLFLCLAG